MAKKIVTVRLDEALLKKARKAAKSDHRTLTNYIEFCIIKQLEKGPGTGTR